MPMTSTQHLGPLTGRDEALGDDGERAVLGSLDGAGCFVHPVCQDRVGHRHPVDRRRQGRGHGSGGIEGRVTEAGDRAGDGAGHVRVVPFVLVRGDAEVGEVAGARGIRNKPV